MPTYVVRLRVVVAGLGSREVDFPNITAPTLEEAITAAKAIVIVEPIQVQKTAD